MWRFFAQKLFYFVHYAGVTQFGMVAGRAGARRFEKNARRSVSRVLSPLERGMAIHLRRPSPDAWRDQPGRPVRKHTCREPCGPGAPPLFGLAPGGVCRAADVAAGAVRSYRTLSPLPASRGTEAPGPGRAVCFLWHFPWGRPRRALPGTVFPWSPDFPPPGLRRKAAIRPSGTPRPTHGGPRIQASSGRVARRSLTAARSQNRT